METTAHDEQAVRRHTCPPRGAPGALATPGRAAVAAGVAPRRDRRPARSTSYWRASSSAVIRSEATGLGPDHLGAGRGELHDVGLAHRRRSGSDRSSAG